MIDPPRLGDDEGSPGASLLRAARAEAPPAYLLERTLAAVAVGATVNLVPGAVAAKMTAKAGTAALAKWMLAGFAGGLITSGGAAVVHYAATKDRGAEQAAVRAPATGSSPQGRAPVAAGPDLSPRPEPPSRPPPGAAFAPRAAVRHAVATPSTPESPSPSATGTFASDSAIATEVRLIDEARQALAEGRARDALATVDRYFAAAPSLRLVPEAYYLRMEANVALGDRGAAERSARVLLDRYPDGPHAPRARRVLHGE